MRKRTLITICLAILFVCGSFVFAPRISQAQKDVKKPSSTPAKTASPTPQSSPSPVSTSNTNSNNSSSNEKKKIIVVLDFDNVSPQCRDEIYGKNVATQLSTAFSSTGQYTVIEKQRIDKIFDEINVSQDERYDAATAARVGKVLSATTVVLGTIRQCSIDTKLINALIGQAILHTVEVSMAIRLVNINTGEIQDAVSISESSTDKSGCIKGFCSVTAITPDLQIKLFNKAVEKAVKKSVKQLSSIIEGKSEAIATSKIEEKPKQQSQTTQNNSTNSQNQTNRNNSVSTENRAVSIPKVVAVNGAEIYITGLGSGVKVGDIVSIIRGKEIKNAETGAFIEFVGDEIAKAEIVAINENTIKAKVITKIIKGKEVKDLDFVKLLK